VGLDRAHDRLHVQAERRDSFLIIFQLRDHASHEYWLDGRPGRAPASPEGCVHISDCNAAPAALITDQFDSLNFAFPRKLLDELADDIGAPPVTDLAVPKAWQTPDPVLARLAPSLLGALEDRGSVSSYFVDHLATSTALHIAERYGGLRRPVIVPRGLASWQERRAREVIAANLSKEVTLAEVAAECGLSVSYFSKAFKASVGATPHGWLQSSRVDRAREMLKRPTMSFAEIALACGFADQSHFTRIFKRATGFTPGAWRRSRLG
jgi:AraC-like DNA-binding protein